MKNMIALLLSAAMLLTMTACGGTTEPTLTTTAETTESVATAGFETTPETSEETAYIGIAEEVLQNGNAVTESYSDLLEYENKLHELGYVELYFGTNYCKPESLTYNDQAFCFVFSYYDDNHHQEDKWVMYGTKSDANRNITNYSDDYLLGQDVAFAFDFLEGRAPDSIRNLTICPQITETQSQSSFSNPSFALYLYSAYYPTSNNLYNCYREGATMEYSYAPGIIKPWNWVLDDYFANLDLPEFYFCVNQLVNSETKELVPMRNANTTLSNIYCIYEPGMTIKDWVESQYNLEGWTWFQDDRSSGIISPEHNENVYVVLAEYHEDGSMYTIDEYLNNKDCPGVPILHYEDYCVLFDK